MVDEGGDRRVLVLRAAVAVLCSLVATAAAALPELRALDVALYAVLAPIAALSLLAALPRACGVVRLGTRGPSVPSVVPEPDAASDHSGEPTLTRPELTVARARDRVLHAGAAGADLEELLALSTALHDAALELARATLTGGGHVPQELRDEITLQDRAERVETETRTV